MRRRLADIRQHLELKSEKLSSTKTVETSQAKMQGELDPAWVCLSETFLKP